MERRNKLVLSHNSALDYIRDRRWYKNWDLRPTRTQALENCACSMSDIERIGLPRFEQGNDMLEILVPSASLAYRSDRHVCRVLKTPPISGMFCKIENADSVYVTSPEMTFVQMATRLPLLELILLGMELCGTYAMSPSGDKCEGRPAITSKAKLVSFCRRATGMRGASSAAKAVRWIVDNSNSPAETALLLYLCLPSRLGGYGFEYPDMNPETPLGVRASRMLGHEKMRCDLHWVDKGVVIEYDSDQEHLTSQSASTDALRRNALGIGDIKVISVRRPMIVAPAKFNEVVRLLARALGRRLRSSDLVFTEKRANLRTQLFPWLIV